MQHGKKYRAIVEKIDKEKTYPLAEAIELIKAGKIAKFDESVEAHFKLNINPKKGEENVRATTALPHGTGKPRRVAVVTTTKESEAKEAGADLVGGEELIAGIKDGKVVPGLAFDILVATSEVMPKLATVAKILGPKGMMPNPKTETVTAKIKETVEALKKGSKISFKNDDGGNIHQVIGKLSFEPKQLEENFQALLEMLRKGKPETVKGKFIQSVSLCSTMGPAVKIKI